MITKNPPKDSFYHRLVKDPNSCRHFKRAINQISKEPFHQFCESFNSRIYQIYEESRFKRIASLISPLKDELDVQEFGLMTIDEIPVYVGAEKYKLVDLADYYGAWMPHELSILIHYAKRGADEISISPDLAERLAQIPIEKAPYEKVKLQGMHWICFRDQDIRVPRLEKVDPEKETPNVKYNAGLSGKTIKRKISGAVVLDYSKLKSPEWDHAKKFYESTLGVAEPISICLIAEGGNPENSIQLQRIVAKDLKELREKVEFIQLGLGYSLGLEFDTAMDRDYSFDPNKSIGLDDTIDSYIIGHAMDLAIKAILYSQSEEVSDLVKKFRPPIDPNRRKHKKTSSKKKAKFKKRVEPFFQITYLNNNGKPPEWLDHEPAKSPDRVNPIYYTSHYRRVWVIKEYIDRNGINQDQVIDYQEAKGRKNRYGEIIYKERYRIAIKVGAEDALEPEITVKRML